MNANAIKLLEASILSLRALPYDNPRVFSINLRFVKKNPLAPPKAKFAWPFARENIVSYYL